MKVDYPSGKIVIGEYRDGIPHGIVAIDFTDDETTDLNQYVGKVDKDGLFQGIGHISWKDGATYDGDFEGNKRHGYGIWRMGKHVYQGEFKDDLRHGLATVRFEDGGIYKGEYKNDSCCGFGVLLFPNGKKYEGQFKDNHPCGFGTIFDLNGEFAFGVWADGKIKTVISKGNMKDVL